MFDFLFCFDGWGLLEVDRLFDLFDNGLLFRKRRRRYFVFANLLHNIPWNVEHLSHGRLRCVAGLRRRENDLVLKIKRHLLLFTNN